MKKAIRLYDQLLLPWLVVVVYLWLLQLIAVFGMHDPEPLFDQAADHVPLIIRYPNQDRGTKSRSMETQNAANGS